MKLLSFSAFLWLISQAIHCLHLSAPLANGPIASSRLPSLPDPINYYPDYRFSQSSTGETIASGESAEAASESTETVEQAGGGDKPAFTLNIHAPQESTEDIIDSIKDLKKLVNEERKAADDDFLVEKKKLVEAQRIRVRDIVHSSFEAINSLIPNPIKAVIRETLNKGDNGTTDQGASANIQSAMKSFNTVKNSAAGAMNKMKGMMGRK